MHTDDDTPRCTACGRGLYETELGHYGCGVCVRRTDEHLASLAGPTGLYARLGGALMPGRAGGEGRVTGSRTAPLPIRLEPLSLSARGGVVTILQTWQIDWFECLGFTHPRWRGGLQQQLDQTVHALRVNAGWAAEQHPAFDDFTEEVAAVRHLCERAVTGERPERPVVVACPCGTRMRITLSTPARKCQGCGEQYGWQELRGLPLAERSAA